jgi:hypothetical protein
MDKLDDCKSLADVEDLLTGRVSEHSLCVDCGVNTDPSNPTKKEMAKRIWEAKLAGREWGDTITIDDRCEVYMVREKVWAEAGMGPYGGCLCIGCLEKRLGRRLRPKDFQRNHPFHVLPGTDRLLGRRK